MIKKNKFCSDCANCTPVDPFAGMCDRLNKPIPLARPAEEMCFIEKEIKKEGNK